MRFISVFLLLLALCSPLQAAQFAVLLNSNDPAYQEFLSSVKASLPAGNQWQLTWSGDTEKFMLSPPAHVDLILAAGTNATRLALAKPDGPPVIASLLSRMAFENISRESPVHQQGVSALFLDQPIARQLAFINKVLPASVLETRLIFTAVSDAKSESLASLRQAAPATGFKVSAAIVENSEAAVPTIDRLLNRKEGLFLAFPDSEIFARDNIRPFLLTTYRYKIPVIAFSLPFVQAGALAALHTTPTQFGQELASWVTKLPSARPITNLPPPKSPTLFSVSINTQVARSLKLSLPSESEILSSLTSSAGNKP
jgi:putative ABC transport system substrate-binding protein